MTNEQLVLRIRTGENVTEYKRQLYEQNLGIIKKIANLFHGLEEDEDLKQEAYFGLMRAVELWNPKQETSFISYAYYWIKQSMLRYIYDHSNLIRVPSYQREKIYKYHRAVNSIRSRFGRDPRKLEIMALLEINSTQYESLLKDVQALRIRSTSETVGGENDDITLEDTIPAEGDPMEDVIEEVFKEELSRALWEQVDRLPERESYVIRSKYQEGKTLIQCGEALGVSPERARQLHESGLRNLRKPSATKRIRPYLTDSTAYSIGLRSGFNTFKVSGESAQERAVMLLERQTGAIWKDYPFAKGII